MHLCMYVLVQSPMMTSWTLLQDIYISSVPNPSLNRYLLKGIYTAVQVRIDKVRK